MRCARAALTLLLALAAVGCGERAEPIANLPPQYPVTVRGAGDRPTELARAPERIVALDPGAAELLAALGARRRVVGAPATVAASVVPRAVTVVRPSGQVEVDVVVALEPDLVVATRTTDPVDVGRVERESGAPVYVQPASSIEDVERAAIELGFLLGEPVTARRLVTSMRRRVTRIEAKVANLERVRVFVDIGFLVTVRDRSLIADLVRRAGGESVAGPKRPPEPFGLCRIARLEPDVFLRDFQHGERRRPRPNFARCRTRPRVSFVQLPAQLVDRAGPRVPDALAAVARALHPDAF